MAVQLTIPYETLVELVEQLPDAKRDDLIDRLLSGRKAASMSQAERLAAYHERATS